MTNVLMMRGVSPEARKPFAVAGTVTIAEIVATALPGAGEGVLARTRVAISYRDQYQVIPRAWWGRVRPHEGTTVIIRVVEGDPVSIGAWVSSAIGGAYYAATGVSLGAFALDAILVTTAIASVAVTSALINSLMPQPQVPKDQKTESRYKITGWRNQVTPDEPVPYPTGQIRVAPVYAAQPFTEVVGDFQYIRALFLFGYGRLDISDLRIGETPISEFAGVDIQIREGIEGDDPVTITPDQVLEESVQVELLNPQPPVDEAGNEIDGDRVEQPHVYTTASHATQASVILHWPNGAHYNKSSGDLGWTDMDVRIRQRAAGTETWSEVTTENYVAKQREAFFRQITWTLPSRGTWEIEVTNLTPRDNGTKRNNRVFLAAVQSIRPEYPINFDKPVALASVRIKATYELNGTLDKLNALVRRYVPVWDGEAWGEGLSRNAASAYVHALQGYHHPFPVGDAGIDWDQVADWWAYCDAKGLTYDADHRSQTSLREMLAKIAMAGRASPRHDGARWGVVIDRPQDVVADHISPRNSWDFEGTRDYIDPPDAVRVKFLDETDDYADAEIIVPWPDHEGPVNLIEEWEVPGKTHPDAVAREVHRRMLEIIHRRDRFTVMQDGPLRSATRGDKVLLSHDVLSSVQVAGRVLSVDGQLVVLDEYVEMEAGETYGLRYLAYDASDTVGDSQLVPVMTQAGMTRALLVQGDELPPEGAVVLFGPTDAETIPCRVLEIEAAEDFAVRLTLTNDAEEIDALTDAYVPAEWDPIIGTAITVDITPSAPRFAGIETIAEEGLFGSPARTLRVGVASDPGDLVPIGSIAVDHRLYGAGAWTTETVTGSAGSVDITGYELDDSVELRLVAYTRSGIEGAYSATLDYLVGADSVDLAGTPDTGSISAVADLGRAVLEIAVADANTVELRIFRTAFGDTLDTETDEIGTIAVGRNASVTYVDGDATRTNLLAGGSFNDAAPWTAGGGWAIAGGAATHTAGAASTLSQAVALTAGKTYRGAITVSGRTAGSVTVQLTGGIAVATGAIDENGQTLVSLDAVTGNDTVEIVATADFDGTVEEAQIFEESAACAPQGTHAYRFAAVNSDDVASAISSAITATII